MNEQPMNNPPSRPAFASMIVLASCLLVVAGCRQSAEPEDTSPSDDTARDAVINLQWDDMTAAFASLREARVVEAQFVEVWHNGRSVARQELQRTFESGTLAASTKQDSSGNFSSGWVDKLVSKPPELSVPFNHWLESEAPYVSPRRQDHYRFDSLPDTMLGDVSVKRFRVTPRSSNGALRSAVFLVTPDANHVVGLHERRAERAPFFRQETDLTVSLNPTDSGWYPDRVVLDVMIDAPARAPRRYRVERTFSLENGPAETR